MKNHRSTWILGALAVVGLALTVAAVTRWAPDAASRWPRRAEVLEKAARDAARLGCRVTSGEPRLQVSAGDRIFSTAAEVRAVTAAERDPAARRRLLESVPPVRIGARFGAVTDPVGHSGELLLEYDGDANLLAAEFSISLMGETATRPGRELADRLAAALLGGPAAAPETGPAPGGRELFYRLSGIRSDSPAGDPAPLAGPVAYVYLADQGWWIVHRQPVAARVVSDQTTNFLRWHPVQQLQVYTLVLAGILSLGLLLWRLARQRAGFSRPLVLLSLLLLGLVPTVGHYYRLDFRVLAVLALYLVLNQVVLLLFWTVGEAELREVRPGSVEHWDRLIRWKPLAATGRHLVRGVAFGCALGGFVAASGAAAALAGGGYGSALVILPDYWSLPTPLNWGLALAAMTALLVAFGGRLGGRPGAMAGAAVSTAGWSLVMPVAPPGLSLFFGLAAAMAAGWLMWRHGLLVLATACVTAWSLPTAWVAWSAAPLLLESALIASLPAVLLPLGWVLMRRASRHGDAQTVAPAYVSALERQAKLRGELDLLRRLQLSLLPADNLVLTGDLEIAWRMIPADAVGGDFLDLVKDRDGRLWLAIADVAGHGISCSLLTAYAKAAVAQHAIAGVGPVQALAAIRRLFGRLRGDQTRPGRQLVTLLLAMWDPARRELAVATAGHPPLLFFDRETVRELGRPGQPLGVELEADDREQRIACPEGAVLVGYSDGVTEAVSPAGEPYTYDRWPALLPALADRPADEILESLLGEVDRHCAGRPAGDDVTAVVVKLCK